MKQQANLMTLLLCCLCALGLTDSPLTVKAQPKMPPAQDNAPAKQPFTYEQLKEHLIAGTKDEPLAAMVDARGVEFVVDDQMIERLAGFGLGDKARAALERQGRKVSRPGQTTILVADIRSVKDDSNGLTETLIRKLKAALTDYSDVKVIPLGERITVQQGGHELAVEKGREHNASLVLWGWYMESPTNVSVTINFDVIKSPGAFPITSEEKEYLATSAVAQNFTLQSDLSDELTTVVMAATGLAQMDAGHYWRAADRFSEALRKQVSPQIVMGHDDIFLLQSLAYILGAASDGEASIKKYIPSVIKDLEGFVSEHDQPAVGYLLLGLADLVVRDYDASVVAFQKVLESDSDPDIQIQAYHMLMIAGSGKNDPKLETESAKSVITLGEKLSPSWLKYQVLGNAYYSLADEKRALENYRRVLEQSPNTIVSGNTYTIIGCIYYRQLYDNHPDVLEQAISANKLAVKYNGKNSSAYNRLGGLYYWKRQYKEAIDYFNTAINLEPANAVYYANRGNARRDAGDVKNARDDYAKAMELAPSDADIYFHSALLHITLGQETDALRDFDKCLSLDPKHVNALHRRAQLRIKRKEFDAGISDLKLIYGLKPEDAAVAYLIGDAFYKKGEYDSAVHYYSEAIKKGARTAVHYFNRGMAYRYAGKKQEAIIDFSRALEIDPTDADFYGNRGSLYIDTKQYDIGIKDLTICLQLNPQNTFARYERAAGYAGIKKYDDAIGDYRKLIEMNPNDATAYFYLGLVLDGKGMTAQAVANFTKALKLKPDYADVYLELALLHLAKGQRQKAHAEFLKVKELSKDPKLLQKVEEQLKQLPAQ